MSNKPTPYTVDLILKKGKEFAIKIKYYFNSGYRSDRILDYIYPS